MQYTKLENTDLSVSRLAFGTASLHRVFQRGRRLKLLDTAFAAGITHFDTSPYYGHGLAESDLGLFLRGRRCAVTISTKVGLYASRAAAGTLALWLCKACGRIHPRLSSPRVDWSVRAAELSLVYSLGRLRTDYVDILFLHEPNPALIDSDEFLTWLDKERSKGRIRYWGLAGVPEAFREWLRIGHPLAAVVQAKDSLDREEANVVFEEGRQLQLTYGYLSSASGDCAGGRSDTVIRKALIRNRAGSVLFSTLQSRHIMELAALFQ